MSFRSFFASIFKDIDPDEDGVKRITVNEFKKKETEFCVDAYALFTVIDFVASLMSNIELQTYYNKQLKHDKEWHRLNIKPNINQNAKDFWKEFWCKLLYYQEALIVPAGDQLIIADEFTHHPEYAVREDIFESVSRGDFTFSRTFKASEVFYLRYSTVDISNTLTSVMNLYGSLVSHAQEVYASSGGERGVLNVNSAATGPEEFEKKYVMLGKALRAIHHEGQRNAKRKKSIHDFCYDIALENIVNRIAELQEQQIYDLFAIPNEEYGEGKIAPYPLC